MRAHDFITEGQVSDEFTELARKFIPFVKKQLELDKLPKIIFLNKPMDGTFGRYYKGTVRVVVKDRHPVDVLRTLAHELVHWKQELNGEIHDGAGDTGSPQENEANAEAGVVMRNFNQSNPDAIK